MLIDTHAHLYWDSYKSDFKEVLQRSIDAGVNTLFIVGVDVEKSRLALQLAEDPLSEYPLSSVEGVQMFSTIGIHPHEAYLYEDDKKLEQDIQNLEQIYLKNPKKVIGVGECGLDYFFNNNSDYIPSHLTENQVKDLQRKLFISQIDLAKKLDLPLIVHIRDDRSKNPENIECWEEALEMVKTHKGILHCYSGLPPTTQNLPPNFLVSFAANITYPKNEYLREAVRILPLEKIVLETDSPFLAPQSKRGQRNESSSVREIAELIAEIKRVTLEEVAEKTSKNVKKLFKIARV